MVENERHISWLKKGIAQNFSLGLFPVFKEAALNLDGSVSAQLFALFFFFFVLVLFLRLMVSVVE